MPGFVEALPIVLKYEGGFVNDPADPGGATNKGVTQAAYDRWRAAEGRPRRDVREIGDNEVAAIYERDYWLAGHCDVLAWPLSLIHFDACVNAGLKQATKLLQRAVRVHDDGVWGAGTVATISRLQVAELLLERLRFYDLLVAQKPTLGKFFRGWCHRVLELREATARP